MTEILKYAYQRPHPWHGLTPFDHVKYELDKATCFLCVDRPQRTTSHLPCLYGFMSQTFCAEKVSELSPASWVGDHDPLNICVMSEAN